MSNPRKRILFVDDDPLILNGYRRSVYEFSESWETFFANSGKSALTILAYQEIDAIITDLKMPEMDGNLLLEQVSNDFAGVIRLVLSGNTESLQAQPILLHAHQVIVKPCPLQKLFDIIENTFELKYLITNPLLSRQVTAVENLPSLSRLYQKLIHELQTDDPDANVIGEIIKQDLAMTAKILQLVNSAFLGLPMDVVSPQKAVTILGVNAIKTLVLGSQIFSEYQSMEVEGLSIENLRAHSLVIGNISKNIAGATGLDSKTQEQAQLAGNLHDIGKLLQIEIPGFLQGIQKKPHLKQLEYEYKILGTSHAEMGAFLLSLWGLPQPVVRAVAYHHHPEKIDEDRLGIATVLHIANGLFYKESSHNEDHGYEQFLNMEIIQKHNVIQSLNGWSMLTRNLILESGIK